MWLYVWTSALKEAYLGVGSVKEIYLWTTKVRPSAQHYTFDFTTSITGWTLWSRLAFTSWVGITRSSSWTGGNQYVYYNNSLDIDWTNVKKITYKANMGWNTGSWYGSLTMWVRKAKQNTSWTDSSTVGAVGAEGQWTTSGWRLWAARYNTTRITSWSPASTQNVEIVLDLVAKQATVTYNWTVVANQVSMSDADIQTMRDSNCQYLQGWLDAPYYKYISLVDLLIEY